MRAGSSHGIDDVVLVAPTGCFAEWQGLTPQPFKAHQPQRPAERLPHGLASAAAGLSTEVREALGSRIQASDGSDHADSGLGSA
jgi:hypothetical protein